MREFFWFVVKQGWACVFGGLLLLGILVTGYWTPGGWHRYDVLFFYAVGIQAVLLLTRLESPREFGVVILFHVLATAMELFKTSDAVGSWAYPGEAVIRLGNVPLFAGFMYSAVGSYMARVWRIFDFRFEHFPPLGIAAAIAVASYLNFFTHHFIWDLRWVLLAAVGFFYFRTRILFRPERRDRSMNLLLGFALVTFFIWLAENIGTYAKAWAYPNQKDGWELVGFGKFTSWFLLMQLSFVLICLLRRLEAAIGGK